MSRLDGYDYRPGSAPPIDREREAAHKNAWQQAASSNGFALGPGPSPLVYGPEGAIASGFGHAPHQQPALERLVRLANAAIAAGLEEEVGRG